MFEESKAWFFILIISVLIGLGYSAHYFSSVDLANAALLESKTKLAGVHELLHLRKKIWTDMETANFKVREAMGKNEALLKAKDIVDKRYRTVDSDLKYVVTSMKASVDKARNDAPGSELGDITLANGKVLRGAKVRKVEESGISLIHSDGIGTVTLDLLPTELKEKYDLGSEALVPKLIEAQTNFLANPTANDTNTKSKTVATTSAAPIVEEPAKKPSMDDAKVKTIKFKIVDIETRTETLKSSITAYERQAADNYTNGDLAKSRGQPASKYWTIAEQATQQARALQAQIIALEAEKKKLDIELQGASSGK
jgi:hypothetical protein